MKQRNILKWIILAIASAINVFILANSFVTGNASTEESKTIVSITGQVINAISPGFINDSNIESFTWLIRKLYGHFGLFAISGIFSTWSLYLFLKESKFYYFLYLGGISLFAGLCIGWLSETFQLFMPGRSASASDVVIDFFGYFIGVLLVIFILFLAKKPIFSKLKQEEK